MTATTTVYLLCFRHADGSKAWYKRAGHYTGSTSRSELDRLADHLAGHGSPLVRAAVAAGMTAVVTRTWEGGRQLERTLKNRKHAPRFCPECSPGNRRAREPDTLSSAEEMIS